MIRIIRQGQELRRMTCISCGCVFEFTDDEIHYDDEFFPQTVKCPHCKRWLSVPFHSDDE